MGEPKETIWKIEPHTLAKHELLTRYLDAWFPILASWNDKVLFLDGFAGPGRYAGGEPGSPLLAIQAARDANLKKAKALFLFNESHKGRHAELHRNLEEVDEDLPSNFQLYLPDPGKFVDFARGIVDQRGNGRLVPTFAFVDPFGWSGVPMKLIAELVRDQRSELFILFSFNSVNRWITHPAESQQENMRELFGCDDYQKAAGMVPAYRKEFLAGLYEKQLRDVGKFMHVSRFEMIEKQGRTSYFLYHCTRSMKGLEVMRSVMWKIDPANGRSFSDQVAGLESLFDGPMNNDLQQRIIAQFSGKRVSIREIQDYVLTDTPFALEHLKKPVLKPMQQDGLIAVYGQKIRGTFPDRVEVEFLT